MVSKDHDLSVRRQCGLLSLVRSNLYYQPKGESAENLRFMAIIENAAGRQWFASQTMRGNSWRHRGTARVKWPVLCSGKATSAAATGSAD
jgi:hypothetical protein